MKTSEDSLYPYHYFVSYTEKSPDRGYGWMIWKSDELIDCNDDFLEMTRSIEEKALLSKVMILSITLIKQPSWISKLKGIFK